MEAHRQSQRRRASPRRGRHRQHALRHAPAETAITGLRLDATGSGGDYPRGYKVELSADGQTWGKPVATGEGKTALTEIKLPPTKTKFIRITQTGSVKGLFWSIHELDILGEGQGKITEGKATAKKLDPKDFQ
jgi:hypothetical protein